MRRVIPLLLAAAALLLCGCMPMPRPALSPQISAAELESHIRFLAQPALRGRKPRTAGSRFARQYIAAHFAALNLKPWGEAETFHQPFIIGTNVVGLLPGSDQGLADEFVIVSAHYDHLGEHEGQMHLGATDNASGVAAMLEIATELSHAERRPRRSVVFAAFDAEEVGLLGAYAFTCRDDFVPARLAGVINLDGLGRHSFEVLDDVLIVFGSERYPSARNAAIAAGRAASIRVLPLGRDLVGPRSDHVPFEAYGPPVLFFTSGLYRDYHKPTDTVDRIDYPKLNRESQAIAATVEALANAAEVEPITVPTSGDDQELEALRVILEAMVTRPQLAGKDEATLAKLKPLLERGQELGGQMEYTLSNRSAFVMDVTTATLPLVLGQNVTEQQAAALASLNDVYVSHTDLWTRGMRELVQHIMDHPPLPLWPAREFNWAATDISDHAIRLDPTGHAGHLRLSICAPHIEYYFSKRSRGLRANWLVRHIVGSREALIDSVLLEWLNTGSLAWASQVWHGGIVRLAEVDISKELDAWLNWRLEQTGHADRKTWLMDLLSSDDPQLTSRAALASPVALGDASLAPLSALLQDRSADSLVRSAALVAICRRPTPQALLEVMDVIASDASASFVLTQGLQNPEYPFRDRPVVRQISAWSEASAQSATIGHWAIQYLAQATGQNFGDDASAWKQWIQEHAQELRGRVQD